MVAVSDTSPISNLSITGRLDLLRSQFSQVLIPEGVRRALRASGQLGFMEEYCCVFSQKRARTVRVNSLRSLSLLTSCHS